MFQLIDAGFHEAFIEMMHILPASEFAQQQDGQLAAEVLAEFFQPFVHPSPARSIADFQRLVPQGQPQGFENIHHPLRIGLAQMAQTRGKVAAD